VATLLATVAVAAVLAGGVLAARRGPQTELGAAAPLAGAPKPAPVFSGPAIVKVDAPKLVAGDAPKVTYLRDRTVLGADGTAVQVPGRTEIIGVGRLQDAVLTVQLKSVTSASLVALDASGKQIGQVAGVDSLVTRADGQAVAYASGGRFAPGTGEGKPGPGIVYHQRSMTEPARQLPQPKSYDLTVLGVTDNTVYFRSGGIEGAWDFYRWQVEEPKPTLIRTVRSPVAVSADGKLVAGLTSMNDSGMCTALMDATSGTQQWRTCEYQPIRFGPGSFVISTPPGSSPYGFELSAVLDVKTGNRLRQWTAPTIRDAIAEDDDHVLLQWHDQQNPASRSALVRCTVSSGACELATPLASGPLLIGS
jgi:hypothetical protein